MSYFFCRVFCVFGMIVTLSDAKSEPANVQIEPSILATPVVCQASLLAIFDREPSNPTAALQVLGAHLKSREFLDPRYYPYSTNSYTGDLAKLSEAKGLRNERVLAYSRISQLIEDLKMSDAKKGVIGHEFRGEEEILAARNSMVQEINRLNPEVLGRLQSRYPTLRIANVFKHMVSALFLLTPAFSYFAAPPGMHGEVIGRALLPIGLFATVLNEVIVPRAGQWWRSLKGFEEQIKMVDDVLDRKYSGSAVSIVSASMEIREPLHNQMLSNRRLELSDRDVEMLVDASEDIKTIYSDIGWRDRELGRANQKPIIQRLSELLKFDQSENIKHVDLRVRNAYFDSIFFVNPENHQPIWLVFYRAIRKI